MKIFKYPLVFQEAQVVVLPIGAKILTIKKQNDVFVLWALVDEFAATEIRGIRIYGTGQEIGTPVGTYISTVEDGAYIWHFFEVT